MELRKNRPLVSQNRGFALYEMLIAMAIMLATLPPLIGIMASIYHKTQTNEFLTNLSQALTEAQMLAISRSSYSYVNINDQNIRLRSGTHVIRAYHFPPSIKIIRGTRDLSFTFLPNGHLREPGTLFIKVGEKTYKLVILLGQGRFYIEEV